MGREEILHIFSKGTKSNKILIVKISTTNCVDIFLFSEF